MTRAARLARCRSRLVAAFFASVAMVAGGAATAAASADAPAVASAATATTATPRPIDAGEDIFRRGLLPGGQPLHGERRAGSGVDGPAAACLTCHRPSGLGTSEGRIVIPPIIGKYLFRPHSTNVADLSLPHLPSYRSQREPYTEASLARAIREGVAPNGRALSDLMPRFALDDAAMRALVTYLGRLSAGPMPGVSDDVLHFATIVTPDADPATRNAMLSVMDAFFADKNAFIRGGGRPLHSSREIEYRVSRRWELHVWSLTGPPDGWEAQLRGFMDAEPVFAVISGLGGADWAPIHRFCQERRVPCLWPNTAAPVVAETDFYSLYFSRGVLLESDLVAHAIGEPAAMASDGAAARAPEPKRLVQVLRPGDIGEAGAAALGPAAGHLGLATERRLPKAGAATAASWRETFAGVGATDTLMLWLRPADLASLPPTPPDAGAIYVSGLMGGLEQAPLPPAWRGRVQLVYPFDLPEQRKVRMNFPLSWMKIRRIPIVDEHIQTDTYVACGILAETLTDMLDSFIPDYLVERMETMLSHRLVNGYYPRLSLGPGQRFASKGGLIVRFAEPAGTKVVAVGDWVVP